MPKVSILVPIYNTEQYLKECIQSLITQTYKNIEIILVDDGSTDKSLKICEEYKHIDKRIKIYHQENQGLVSARISAIHNASGEYILCVDSDDYINSDTIEKMLVLAIENKADVICSGYVKEKPTGSFMRNNFLSSGVYSGTKLKDLKSKLIYSGIFYRPGIMPFICNKLISRNLYEKFQVSVPREITRGEDVAVIFPLLLEASRIVIDNEFKPYHYRKNNLSICHTIDSKHFEHKKTLYAYLDRKISNPIFKTHLEYYKIFGIISGIEFEIKSNKKSFISTNKYLRTKINNFNLDKNLIKHLIIEKTKYTSILKSILRNDYLNCIIKYRLKRGK